MRDCDRCHGTRWTRINRYGGGTVTIKCPPCKGTGQRIVEGGAPDERIPDVCLVCDGSGRQ